MECFERNINCIKEKYPDLYKKITECLKEKKYCFDNFRLKETRNGGSTVEIKTGNDDIRK